MTYQTILQHYGLTDNQVADMFKISVDDLQNSKQGTNIKKGIEQFHYTTVLS